MSIMTELATILKNIAFRLHTAHSGKESDESVWKLKKKEEEWWRYVLF